MLSIMAAVAASGMGQNPLAEVRWGNPLVVQVQSASVPKIMPATYGSVRERVVAGEAVLIAVGVDAPVGYTAVTDAPNSVAKGLYHCVRENGVPVMRQLAMPVVRPVLNAVQQTLGTIQYGVQRCVNGVCR